MTQLNEEKITEHIKKTFEKLDETMPKTSSNEMWKKIKEEEKRRKRKNRFKQIPVYASSFIAVVAITFLIVQMPTTSDHATMQHERQVADIDRAYEEIQNATMFMKEASVVKDYPGYLPAGYVLQKEEIVEENRMLYYEGEGKQFKIQVLLAKEEAKGRTLTNQSPEIERTIDGKTLRISGELAEEELIQIVESMYK